MELQQIQEIEIELLLETIWRRYGYDFRHYARSSLKRTLDRILHSANFRSPSEILPKLLYEEDFSRRFLQDLSIPMTEMFRDGHFFCHIRQKVVPVLQTYPFIKIWHAGCATGEEAYSMAIILQEEGVYHRAQIYATDFNEECLAIARQGAYPLSCMAKYSENYQQAGGKGALSDYYDIRHKSVYMRDCLKEKIVFTPHNLVIDGIFGEMNLIFCRNVLIYFDDYLKAKTLSLLYDSLCYRGFLCLGSHEGLSDVEEIRDKFETISQEKIYRKI